MYYVSKVKYTENIPTKGGGTKEKNFNREYLVEALSCTEAEAKTVKGLEGTILDYEVKEVKQSRIEEVFE
jgi:hypothetical protein